MTFRSSVLMVIECAGDLWRWCAGVQSTREHEKRELPVCPREFPFQKSVSRCLEPDNRTITLRIGDVEQQEFHVVAVLDHLAIGEIGPGSG